MGLMGVADAADRLGVSSRRVRQMLADGTLPGQRVGRTWVIEERSLRTVASDRRGAHRPWNPSSAWAVLGLADGAEIVCTTLERSRAQRRLAGGLGEIRGRLESRAQKRRYYVHPSAIARIAARTGIVRTAASASREHHLGLVGGTDLEAYIRRSDLQQLIDDEPAEERTDLWNLLLRVVEDHVWPFPPGAEFAPRAVVAVDALESEDERVKRAGAELLGQLDADAAASR